MPSKSNRLISKVYNVVHHDDAVYSVMNIGGGKKLVSFIKTSDARNNVLNEFIYRNLTFDI